MATEPAEAPPSASIQFPTVSRELRSLVARRREILTLLGSVFAALGIFLENVLEGSLPPSLKVVEGRVFASYAFLLMIPSLILALRLACLNSGMVFNGVLYAGLLKDAGLPERGDPARARMLNRFGVSFLMFLLTDAIASFSAVLLALRLLKREGATKRRRPHTP